jgi:Ribbon-helix-helix protein, copG family
MTTKNTTATKTTKTTATKMNGAATATKATTRRASKSYGRTKSGKLITDAHVKAWTAQAERGYDLDALPRRGRPTLGAGPARTVQVRIEPELHDALATRAKNTGVSASAVVRDALRLFLAPARGGRK